MQESSIDQADPFSLEAFQCLMPSPIACDSALLIGSGLLLGGLACAKWWSKGFSGSWRTTHEGWFGKGTYAGGVDKLSHVYSLYAGTRLLVRGLDFAGRSHQASVRTASVFGLGAALAAEAFDAFSKEAWGFSKEDLIGGVFGVGMAVIMESKPELDDLLAFRLLYRPSSSTRNKWNPVDQYNNQTYLLALKIGGLRKLQASSPLRYVELVAGYGATGFGQIGNGAAVHQPRRRTLYVGLALDLTRLINGNGRSHSPWRGIATEGLRYLQIPGSVALLR